MTNLTEPITVYRGYVDCGEHEICLITDGTRAYATGPITDATGVWRDGPIVNVTCGQPLRSDDPCERTVMFDISEDGTWTSNSEAIRLVIAHGQDIQP